MSFDSDIDIYFSDFAVDAVYTPQGGSASTIKVIFNNEYAAAMSSIGVGIEGALPEAVCKTSDVTNAKHSDTLTVGSTTYHVLNVQPDGTGITILTLSKDVA